MSHYKSWQLSTPEAPLSTPEDPLLHQLRTDTRLLVLSYLRGRGWFISLINFYKYHVKTSSIAFVFQFYFLIVNSYQVHMMSSQPEDQPASPPTTTPAEEAEQYSIFSSRQKSFIVLIVSIAATCKYSELVSALKIPS